MDELDEWGKYMNNVQMLYLRMSLHTRSNISLIDIGLQVSSPDWSVK